MILQYQSLPYANDSDSSRSRSSLILHSFSAYLHDLVDILLYLLMPMEDFRSRPFRFLVREIFVRRIILPVLDLWATPDFMNHMLVWLVCLFRGALSCIVC